MAAGMYTARMSGNISFIIRSVAGLAEFIVRQAVDVESECICGAGLTGIDQSDISKIERGVANPSIGTIARIADALEAELKISIQ